MSTKRPICMDTDGTCFARTKLGRCSVLNECSEQCAFKKASASVTNGKNYPINLLYAGMNDSGGREMTGKAWREAHGNTLSVNR